MNDMRAIVLIGPRASGKTTIGRLLAGRLGRRFVDLDDRALASFAEPTIAEAWRVHGESAWRDAEAGALREALAAPGPDQVLALGGGTIMIDAARDQLQRAREARRAVVIYLQCGSETLQQRLREAAARSPDGAARPPLMGADAIEEVPAVLAAREPTYRRFADVIVDAERALPDQVVVQIISALSQ